MTTRATFTEAELSRATKVAQKTGMAVEIERGVIRLVDRQPTSENPADLVDMND